MLTECYETNKIVSTNFGVEYLALYKNCESLMNYVTIIRYLSRVFQACACWNEKIKIF